MAQETVISPPSQNATTEQSSANEANSVLSALSGAISAYGAARGVPPPVAARGSAAPLSASSMGVPAASARASGSSKGSIHPEGDAHNCLRANNSDSYGGVTNTCGYAVSYIHCHINPTKDRGDSWAFHCDRPGGLWTNSQPAGMLGPGKPIASHFPWEEALPGLRVESHFVLETPVITECS